MNILALDCATKTGWATLIEGQIESGVQDFTKTRGESNGLMFMRFNAWLEQMNELIGNDVYELIIYERAHHRGGAPTEIGVNLTGRVQEFGERHGSEYMAVHTATLKKFTTGSGRASKDDMKAWYKKTTGREPIDDNEADARALLYYATNEFRIKPRGVT